LKGDKGEGHPQLNEHGIVNSTICDQFTSSGASDQSLAGLAFLAHSAQADMPTREQLTPAG